MNTYSGTYTFASNDTGGTKDLGATHTYRYVNATNVYNKGKADGATGALTLILYCAGYGGSLDYPLNKKYTTLKVTAITSPATKLYYRKDAHFVNTGTATGNLTTNQSVNISTYTSIGLNVGGNGSTSEGSVTFVIS